MVLETVELPNNERIAYREREGGEQVVILVHGNMTSSKHWDILMEAMDPKYKLIAVDLRGFGRSTYNKRITGIKDFSTDLKLFVDALGLQTFHLIGWSTGGAVCMQFVADYPGYCEKLVLLASASTRGYPFFGTKVDGSPDLERRLATIEEVEQDAGKTLPIQRMYDTANRPGLKMIWNALIYTHNKPGESKYEEYIDDMLTQKNLADVYQALNLFNMSGTRNGLNAGTDQAKDITIPVLLLRGDRDYVITEQMAQEIVADLSHTITYIPLDNTGHSPMIDSLYEVKQEIESFLD